MKDFKVGEATWRERAMKTLAAMDRLNTKWCQEELERIKSNTYSAPNFDCSNCNHADCDPKTAFLTELQALLDKYNVEIIVEDGDCNTMLYANFDGAGSIDFWCQEITPQGLKDVQYTMYDK